MTLLSDLRRKAGVRSLLSTDNSNPKVAKNIKLGYETAVLHLAPANMSGREVCPKRSPGCTAACLHYAGSPAFMQVKNESRIRKTRLFFEDRDLFMNILALEMLQHLKKHGSKAAFRLNATSDICWEAKKFNLFSGVPLSGDTIISCFPTDTIFYDYTAIPNRRVPANYDLTFSLKEQNMNDAILARKAGLNVAVVFFDSDLPETFAIGDEVLPVIDGDETDFRPADRRNCVVGLKAKGVKGRADETGFVQHKSSRLLLAA